MTPENAPGRLLYWTPSGLMHLTPDENGEVYPYDGSNMWAPEDCIHLGPVQTPEANEDD